jgi:uncharacterized Tic20 family protein
VPALIALKPSPSPLRTDPQFLQLLNLSALSVLVFLFLNLLVPYLLWRKHCHDTEHVAELGRQILGFQMLWQVACFFAYLVALLLQAASFHYFGVSLTGLFLAVFDLTYLANVVMRKVRVLRYGNASILPVCGSAPFIIGTLGASILDGSSKNAAYC